MLYYFSVAAIINYQKLGSLKQQKFILLQSLSPEVWNQSTGRGTIPTEALGENLFPASSSFH